jgi:carbon starvation protein
MVYGTVFGILLLEGFLVTTIDTIIRLNRYLLEEFWSVVFSGQVPQALQSRALNTAAPLLVVLLLTFSGGYKLIWPLFGTANQLLAALTLTTATVWLFLRKRPFWFTALPALFMVLTTMASLVTLIGKHLEGEQWLLLTTDFVLVVTASAAVLLAVTSIRRSMAQVAPPLGDG